MSVSTVLAHTKVELDVTPPGRNCRVLLDQLTEVAKVIRNEFKIVTEIRLNEGIVVVLRVPLDVSLVELNERADKVKAELEAMIDRDAVRF